MTDAVVAKIQEVCEAYLDPSQLQPIAITAVEEVRKAESHDSEIQSLHSKIDGLTANLDKMYMDRLTGLLAESDFERIYQRIKMERNSLEEKLKDLEAQKKARSAPKTEPESWCKGSSHRLMPVGNCW